MKKNLIIFVLLVLAIGLGYFYFQEKSTVPNKILNSSEQDSLLKAELIYTEGSVEYKKEKGDWKRAVKGTELVQGDSVEVVGSGRAIINLDDGSVIRLGSSSQVVLSQMKADDIKLTNKKGYIYTRVAKLDKRQFTVDVDKISYQSLGTAYKTINEKDLKGVEVYHNKVKIYSADMKENITVEEGKKYYVVYKTSPDSEKKVLELKVDEIKKDGFVMWNKTKDADNSDYKENLGVLEFDKSQETKQEAKEVTTKPVVVNSNINLTGKVVDGGVYLSWNVSGLDTNNGFKMVKSKTINPVYPGSYYKYLSNKNIRSYTWNIIDGNTYYFRVCKYLGNGKCGEYSNNIKLTTPNKKKETSSSAVKSISVSSKGNGSVVWSVNGKSKQGFKLVWSKTSGPTYPTRSTDKYKYFSNFNTRSGSISKFDGKGKYYVRVCEYLGGKCGLYSNQIQVSL
jgi:hypothetical protein